MTRPSFRVFDEWTIRQAVDERTALAAADVAFRAVARGEVTVPPPVNMEFAEVHGELHVKGAHLRGASYFVFKVATGFYSNVQFGVPTGSGVVIVFDAETGFPRAILADNGYLTDLRTAAAGALAVHRLAPDRPLAAAVLGAGVQARLQLQFMSQVRHLTGLRVWSRTRQHAAAYVKRMADTLPMPLEAVESVSEAVRGADLIVTVTPSREPLVRRDWVAPGATIIAIGSDGPEKLELEPALVAGADKVVTDLTSQCLVLGELHHAVGAGLMKAEDVHAELGQILEEMRPGREGSETIVCDLTGVGAQDAAMAVAAYEALLQKDSPGP